MTFRVNAVRNVVFEYNVVKTLTNQ